MNNAEDPGSIPGSGKSLGEGNGNPLQYLCLESPMGRGASKVTVHGITKTRTRVSDFTFFHLGHEHRPLINEVSALIKRGSKRLPAPSDPYNEKSATWNRALTWQCWHPKFGFSASRTERNKMLLFLILPV